MRSINLTSDLSFAEHLKMRGFEDIEVFNIDLMIWGIDEKFILVRVADGFIFDKLEDIDQSLWFPENDSPPDTQLRNYRKQKLSMGLLKLTFLKEFFSQGIR